MSIGDDPLAAAGRDDGYVRRLGQLDQRLFRIGPRHAAPRVYEGQRGPGDDPRGLPKVFRAGHDARDRGGTPQPHLFPLHPGFWGHLYQDGTGTAGAHLPERFEHGVGNLARPGCLSLPLGHGAHGAALVRDLVHGAKVLADGAAGNLARYEEYGHGARVCVGQAGSRVVEAYARDHQRDPRLARSAGIAVGHVRRRLFVPRGDHANAGLVPDRGDDAVNLYARYSEYDLHALPYKRFGKRFPSAQLDHVLPPPCDRRGNVLFQRPTKGALGTRAAPIVRAAGLVRQAQPARRSSPSPSERKGGLSYCNAAALASECTRGGIGLNGSFSCIT